MTNAINRIIEDMNHRFLEEVLTRDFVSSDLRVSARNLRKERQQSVEILPQHLAQIKIYLKAMDLIVECPVRNGEIGMETQERVLFTQPGMRYFDTPHG